MAASRVLERYRLEQSLVRARWLGVAALVLLAALSSVSTWALWGPAALLAAGNFVVWRLGRQVGTLEDQRRLGVAATALDATVVWAMATLATSGLTPSIYAVFMLIVAEVSVRYAPLKGIAVSAALVATLAGAMALQSVRGNDPFDAWLFAFWSALILLVGTLVGTAVREIYRPRPALAATLAGLDPVMEDLLTRRERQVLAMITEGQSNARIAEALVIERKTVKNHINSIYSKLHLNSRYEAITRVLAQRQRQDRQPTPEEAFHA